MLRQTPQDENIIICSYDTVWLLFDDQFVKFINFFIFVFKNFLIKSFIIKQAIEENRIVVFLGAEVSRNSGILLWDEVIERINDNQSLMRNLSSILHILSKLFYSYLI